MSKEKFDNSPSAIAKYLNTCPNIEPYASDPYVGVVVEDSNGRMEPVTGIWYDKNLGVVRLTVEAKLVDAEEGQN